jgi:tol-pal system-associated acyl-CoA thioesterase
MSGEAHIHEVVIYYEDTDLTGAVYHANYLCYFERAREHAIGVDELVALYKDPGVGFVVYRVDLTYREPAVHGDRLEIVSTAKLESDYRVVFHQTARRASDGKELVTGRVELVCVSTAGELVPVPEQAKHLMRQSVAL